MKSGAKMIAESALEAVPNGNPERDYEIDFTIPEFTCLCPRSNFPDFATIRIHYVPDRSLVELKSLKLYINKFRDQEMFHEAAVNRSLDGRGDEPLHLDHPLSGAADLEGSGGRVLRIT